MIKAIVFDFFGVICPDLYWAWLKDNVSDWKTEKDFYQRLSNQLDLGQISTEEFSRTLSDKSGIASGQILPQIHSYIVIDQEILAYIKTLKKKYKLGLLSNSRASIIEKIINENGASELFDAIVISEEVGFIKPQKEIFEIALKELGVKPNEALFIDDRQSNVEGAEKLGISSFVYTKIGKLKEELAKKGIYGN